MTTIYVPYHLDERLDGLVDEPADVTVTVEFPGDGDIWGRLAVLYERVADEVSGAEAPVVISGDCTTALGTVAGLQRRGVDPAIVWFDAHGDVQTLETTTSGYIGGMPLRVLVGYRPELIADRLGIRALAEERAVLVDARDLDPAEEEYLRGSGIRRYQLRDLELPEGPLVVHVDLDVVDAAELPGLLFPVPGGPSLGAVLAKVEEIIATGRVVAVDLACTWRPGNGAGAREFVQTICKGYRKNPNKFRTQRDRGSA
ncbi:arginase family protein [Dactylosporangium sp. NPDC000521]|uniref:arginase family protein n=1 Tax=Dactylosporangium sp. NPDC000521 TaxID=3363975 RepID=UPI00369188C0